MIATFRRLHGLEVGQLRATELAEAQSRVAQKFATPSWTADVP